MMFEVEYKILGEMHYIAPDVLYLKLDEFHRKLGFSIGRIQG